MNTGTYISGALHLGLIGWALLGGLFQRAPEPFEVADVSIISGEEFAALTAPAAAPRADVPSEAPAPEPEPEPTPESEPEPAPEPEPTPEPAPEPEPAPAPEPEPEPEAPVVEAPPLPPTPPAEQENESPIADVAAPRPVPRVAPTPAPPAPPDATPGDEVTQAPERTPEAEAAQPEQETTAPEEATTEIVTEAEETREAGLAPPTSIRPTRRPSRPAPVAEAPPAEAPAEPQEQQTAAIDDALAEALGGSETGGTGSAPSGPPLTAGEKDALRVAVGQCWNVGSLSSDALSTTVVVSLSMNEDGTPRTNTIRLASHSGGSDAAARQTFESARRAIIRCGARGYNLPKEKFSRWRDIEMTFNPEKMRIK